MCVVATSHAPVQLWYSAELEREGGMNHFFVCADIRFGLKGEWKERKTLSFGIEFE